MVDPVLSKWDFFDERERALVSFALTELRTRAPARAGVLEEELCRLERAAALTRQCPSVEETLPKDGGHDRIERLVKVLGDVPEYELDLHLPGRAVFGQGYLLAKIHFLEMLEGSLRTVGAPEELCARARQEQAQSIYSKLAEELFLAVMTDRGNAHAVRRGAAERLLKLWEDRLLTEVDDVAPLLESAWHARNQLRPVLGTLLGTSEILSLFRTAQDERFPAYFQSETLSAEEVQAFEEFVFGLSFEEITTLRTIMAARGLGAISVEDARGMLGLGPDQWRPELSEPRALYASYRARKVRASYRALVAAPGPRRTAEEYVVVALLAQGRET